MLISASWICKFHIITMGGFFRFVSAIVICFNHKYLLCSHDTVNTQLTVAMNNYPNSTFTLDSNKCVHMFVCACVRVCIVCVCVYRLCVCVCVYRLCVYCVCICIVSVCACVICVCIIYGNHLWKKLFCKSSSQALFVRNMHNSTVTFLEYF